MWSIRRGALVSIAGRSNSLFSEIRKKFSRGEKGDPPKFMKNGIHSIAKISRKDDARNVCFKH